MNRDELTTRCRYYKGEAENPCGNGDRAVFWGYERKWVDLMLVESDLLVRYWEEYTAAGLADFEPHDGVPALLKALLYNRYMYWLAGSPAGFRSFYRDRYLGHS